MEFELDKLKWEIETFKNMISPTNAQRIYLKKCEIDIEKELEGTISRKKVTPERCILVALCGELTSNSSQQQQAEFASRLLLMDVLTKYLKKS
ncbi:MAG: hypothetical protein WC341_15040 [Bacteroidales bacterium]|jgi:hypothetical protein